MGEFLFSISVFGILIVFGSLFIAFTLTGFAVNFDNIIEYFKNNNLEQYNYYKDLFIKSLQNDKHKWSEKYCSSFPAECYNWHDYYSPKYENIQFYISTCTFLHAGLLINEKKVFRFQITFKFKKAILSLIECFNKISMEKYNENLEDNMPLHNEAKKAIEKLDEQINEWKNNKIRI
jgi:hypothetical protein